VSVGAGLVVVDKPAGLTSHDVVARVRRLAGTRRVGHAGTLDPAATGVLLLGIDAGTKLLGHLALTDKDYTATIRLGQSTVTDDAEGEIVSARSAGDLGEERVRHAILELTGTIQQVPSAVSAIKVDGRRSYARVRAGEQVELAARTVTVSEFQAVAFRRPTPDLLDVDVDVSCTSGTYVRALARDLGAALSVGGHVTALRRTRVGAYDLSGASTLEGLERAFPLVPLADAVASAFPRVDVDLETARGVGHGHPVPLPSETAVGPHGVFGPEGEVLALMEPRDGLLRALVVFPPTPPRS
jgi:tRNA pseudouridine55 synthase